MCNVRLKKLLAAVITTALTLLSICEVYSTSYQNTLICNASEPEIIGDANLDKKVDLYDIILIAQKLYKHNVSDLPKCADHNFDGKIDLYDAISIAECLLGKVRIKFCFADKSEGIELRLANEDYFNNLSQQDLNFRMQKKDASLDEYKDFSKSQILDFTIKQKKLIKEAVMNVQKKINEGRYNLPLNDEIIFINTNAKDECDAAGYTQKNQIYLKNEYVSEYYPGLLENVIAHELFHCLTRANPQFREDMYRIIGFSISKDEPEFPENIQEILISNPDVEKNDSYATFTINGKKRECYMVWYLKEPFQNAGNSFFYFGTTGLIPRDDLSTIYNINAASDFWEILGKNTEYVTAAEECLADNFSDAIRFGINVQYESPEIIKKMITYMKSKH